MACGWIVPWQMGLGRTPIWLTTDELNNCYKYIHNTHDWITKRHEHHTTYEEFKALLVLTRYSINTYLTDDSTYHSFAHVNIILTLSDILAGPAHRCRDTTPDLQGISNLVWNDIKIRCKAKILKTRCKVPQFVIKSIHMDNLSNTLKLWNFYSHKHWETICSC